MGDSCSLTGRLQARMVVKGKKTKNPPVLSHEFVIQNHADIVACVAMVFVVGLMFQISSPAASVFIALHHNVTVPTEIKQAKFNESGQLLAFYITSIVWAGDIVLRENLLSVASLWEGYPHASMSFPFKFFFIIQLSYWLHIFPELYFQKVKRDDWAPKIQYACLYLAFILAAYVTSFTRVALFLLLVHYISEAVFHTCRILAYLEKTAIASKLFKLGDALFVIARLSSVTMSVLTFWFGLASVPADQQVLDLATGNFNTPVVRLAALLSVCLLQAWLMYGWIMFQVKRAREAGPTSSDKGSTEKSRARKTEQERAKARKARKEEDPLPEADQKIKSN